MFLISPLLRKTLDQDDDRRSSYHKRVAKGEEQRGNKDIKVLFELHPKRDQIDQGAPPALFFFPITGAPIPKL